MHANGNDFNICCKLAMTLKKLWITKEKLTLFTLKKMFH